MKKNIDLSIVIPVYNSEDTIETVVEDSISVVEELNDIQSLEIILVNDGSEDDVLSVCKGLCESAPQVKLINLTKNYGQHSALMAGYKFAKGDFVLTMDDDGQTPPKEIPKLIKEIKKGHDVVYGSYKKKKHSWFRNLGSNFNNKMANWLWNKPRDLDLSSFFVVKKSIIKKILNYYGPFPRIPGLIFRVTLDATNVRVKHEERDTGESNYTLGRLISLWLEGFTNFSIKPLRIASFFGGLFATIGFLGIIAVIVRKLVMPDIQVGWSSLIVVITFFGGVQLISLGLVGEYVGRIFMHLNNEPQYEIRETFDIEDKSY
ncbi:MAG: glycosyltransferase family 2 protein [Bacteroidales bacterium]